MRTRAETVRRSSDVHYFIQKHCGFLIQETKKRPAERVVSTQRSSTSEFYSRQDDGGDGPESHVGVPIHQSILSMNLRTYGKAC